MFKKIAKGKYYVAKVRALSQNYCTIIQIKEVQLIHLTIFAALFNIKQYERAYWDLVIYTQNLYLPEAPDPLKFQLFLNQ